MADVKLSLEELRDESESGSLVPRSTNRSVGMRRLLGPGGAIAAGLLIVVTLTLLFLGRRSQSSGSDLVRLSPDDGHAYREAAISPDGGFVAYGSDRSGADELWLQQVGGGEPIQLTHSGAESAYLPAFFPDGKRILYITSSSDGRRTAITEIPALRGVPKVLLRGGPLYNLDPMLSPDGRQIAYFEQRESGWQLMTAASSGEHPRELSNWTRLNTGFHGLAAWTSDNRYLLCLSSLKPQSSDSDEFEWYAVPVDGGNPVATGAGRVLRAAGIGLAVPRLVTANRVVFITGSEDLMKAWDIPIEPGSWRVRGSPRQLTYGALSAIPSTVSATGTLALNIEKSERDLYLVPLSLATGQPIGVAQKLTQDGRNKKLAFIGGKPENVYFQELKVGNTYEASYYSLDPTSGKETLVTVMPNLQYPVVSRDGQHFAYSTPDSNSYSIRMGETGSSSVDARTLCKACGKVLGFSPDGRFLFYQPEASAGLDSARKLTIRLLDVASGEDRPWLEHPSDSIGSIAMFGEDSFWVSFSTKPLGSKGPASHYIIPWQTEPVPLSNWIKVGPLPSDYGVLQSGIFLYFVDASLNAIRFNSKTRKIGAPYEIKFVPGGVVTLRADDLWEARGPGLVFTHAEENTKSIWLMKLSQ